MEFEASLGYRVRLSQKAKQKSLTEDVTQLALPLPSMGKAWVQVVHACESSSGEVEAGGPS